MPLSLHPCSSSPIRMRDLSADSVVLPVPLRPKKSAVLPSAPMFVHDRENRFLDLACIAGAADQHEPLVEIDENKGLAARVVMRRDRVKTRRIDDRELGHMNGLFLGRRLNEKVACKEVVPGVLGNDTDRHAVVRVGARETVLHIDILHLQIGSHALVEHVEVLLRDRLVDRAPPDLVVALLFIDDELVIGRAPSVVPGSHNERPEMGESALAALERLFVERGRRKIPVDIVQVVESMVLKAVWTVLDGRVMHVGLLILLHPGSGWLDRRVCLWRTHQSLDQWAK